MASRPIVCLLVQLRKCCAVVLAPGAHDPATLTRVRRLIHRAAPAWAEVEASMLGSYLGVTVGPGATPQSHWASALTNFPPERRSKFAPPSRAVFQLASLGGAVHRLRAHAGPVRRVESRVRDAARRHASASSSALPPPLLLAPFSHSTSPSIDGSFPLGGVAASRGTKWRNALCSPAVERFLSPR